MAGAVLPLILLMMMSAGCEGNPTAAGLDPNGPLVIHVSLAPDGTVNVDGKVLKREDANDWTKVAACLSEQRAVLAGTSERWGGLVAVRFTDPDRVTWGQLATVITGAAVANFRDLLLDDVPWHFPVKRSGPAEYDRDPNVFRAVSACRHLFPILIARDADVERLRPCAHAMAANYVFIRCGPKAPVRLILPVLRFVHQVGAGYAMKTDGPADSREIQVAGIVVEMTSVPPGRGVVTEMDPTKQTGTVGVGKGPGWFRSGSQPASGSSMPAADDEE